MDTPRAACGVTPQGAQPGPGKAGSAAALAFALPISEV